MNAYAVSRTKEKFTVGTTNSTISNGQLWAGRVLTGLAILFCLFDAVSKLIKPAQVVQATIGLGYRESAIVPIGVTLLVCTILYAIPRTAVLGAILLTGYLGGAVASNVRAGTPVFNLLFPAIFGAIAWGGIWFRDRRVRALMPVIANEEQGSRR